MRSECKNYNVLNEADRNVNSKVGRNCDNDKGPLHNGRI